MTVRSFVLHLIALIVLIPMLRGGGLRVIDPSNDDEKKPAVATTTAKRDIAEAQKEAVPPSPSNNSNERSTTTTTSSGVTTTTTTTPDSSGRLHKEGSGSAAGAQQRGDQATFFATSDTTAAAASPLHFAPGSLKQSRLETFRQCYSHPRRYQNHFKFPYYEYMNGSTERLPALCSFSRRYNVVYYQVEKAGSSTCRMVMQRDFAAREVRGCLFADDPNNQKQSAHERLGRLVTRAPRLHFFTSFREPTARFLSSYQEMLRRWMAVAPANRSAEHHAFSRPLANMTFAERYVLLNPRRRPPPPPPSALAPNASSKNWTLLSEQHLQTERDMFAHFVRDYDASDPWDTHLRLQVPGASHDATGRSFAEFDQIVDTRILTLALEQSSRQRRHGNGTLSLKRRNIHASPSKMLIPEWLPPETRLKICQLTAQDYCCLNYPLPDVCKGVVHCRYIRNPDNSDDGNDGNDWLIEAVSPYPAMVASG